MRYLIVLTGLILLLARNATAWTAQSFRSSRHHLSSTVALRMTTDDQERDSRTAKTNINFLGRGANALVREGVVLVAPTHEFHHFYREAAIFVFAIGENESGDLMIRGVILDHPTPFTLEEMMENSMLKDTTLKDNLLFRGGDTGAEQVIMLHKHEGIGQSAVGTSGIFQGGFNEAIEACKQGTVDSSDFKLFFNYCEFTEATLEEMLDSTEDGDSWMSVEVDPSFVLDAEWDRGGACRRLRNVVRQMKGPTP